jgi:hypothetical protein
MATTSGSEKFFSATTKAAEISRCAVPKATAAADEQERFFLLHAAEIFSTFVENAGPNRERFLSTVAPLIRCAEIKHQRVVLFGEMVALLWAEGRMKAAIELERLGNELVQTFKHIPFTYAAHTQ